MDGEYIRHGFVSWWLDIKGLLVYLIAHAVSCNVYSIAIADFLSALSLPLR